MKIKYSFLLTALLLGLWLPSHSYGCVGGLYKEEAEAHINHIDIVFIGSVSNVKLHSVAKNDKSKILIEFEVIVPLKGITFRTYSKFSWTDSTPEEVLRTMQKKQYYFLHGNIVDQNIFDPIQRHGWCYYPNEDEMLTYFYNENKIDNEIMKYFEQRGFYKSNKRD